MTPIGSGVDTFDDTRADIGSGTPEATPFPQLLLQLTMPIGRRHHDHSPTSVPHRNGWRRRGCGAHWCVAVACGATLVVRHTMAAVVACAPHEVAVLSEVAVAIPSSLAAPSAVLNAAVV